MSNKTEKKDDEAVIEEPIEIEINGKKFRQQENLSFEQDLFLMTSAAAAGLSPGALKGIDLEKKAQDLVVNAYKSGRMFEILGTVLVEVGKEEEQWSEAVTKRNALVFANCRDKAAKRHLNQVLVSLLLGFTLDAKSFAEISLNSSGVVPRPQ